jgi:hypothetical protein
MRNYFITCLIIVLISCASNNRVPSDILPVEKMKLVIWDLVKADEFILNYKLKDSTFKKEDESIRMYNQVLDIHSVNEAEFKKSLNFYENNPLLLKSVFDSLNVMDQYEERKKINLLKDPGKAKNRKLKS